MSRTKDELATAFKLAEFPRSASYDAAWTIDNMMGANVLWLTEYLSHAMDLKPEMRILDLGRGTAINSVFLAKEFGKRALRNGCFPSKRKPTAYSSPKRSSMRS